MTIHVDLLHYAYNAFEPFIDTLTMQIHRDKHHAVYVNIIKNWLWTNTPSRLK